ncbi:hypothetical protein HY484_01280 [Candidatus Woesearchaeota archaeon]|nr:hypothetical protein [Candidatus Woesearchaeota archaeon]
MKHPEAWLLIGITVFVAAVSLLLYFSDPSATGRPTAPVQYRSLARAPYTDLPYDGKPIEMPFAGRCLRDEGDTVFFFTAAHHFYDIAVDGCYTAKDGNRYYYDYFCVGSPEISQAWVKIYPEC